MLFNLISAFFFTYRKRGLLVALIACYRELLRQLIKRVLRKTLVTRRIYNFKMILDLDDSGISRTLWLFGERELDHKFILSKTLNLGAKVLDIGANIGYYAIMESLMVGNNGSVFAVEPSPDNYVLLKSNLKLNNINNVIAKPMAVSDFDGPATFHLAEQSNLNTFEKNMLLEHSNILTSITVDTISVSSLWKEHGKFDYLRMDIEGHEVQVLEQILTLATEKIDCPDIIFETHTRSYKNSNRITNVISSLVTHGYSIDYVASSSEAGTKLLINMGLSPIHTIKTDEVRRTIHRDLSADQLNTCLSETGGIRTVFLKWHENIFHA